MMPVWWTNRSRLPSSGVMKPKPLSSLNHLTVPVAILSRSSDVPCAAVGRGSPPARRPHDPPDRNPAQWRGTYQLGAAAGPRRTARDGGRGPPPETCDDGPMTAAERGDGGTPTSTGSGGRREPAAGDGLPIGIDDV